MEGHCQLTVLAGKDASPLRNSSRVDMVCSLEERLWRELPGLGIVL